MAGLDASEGLALIQENLTNTLNPEIIESIIAEGNNPKLYWGEFTHLSYGSILSDINQSHRYGHGRSSSLRLLRLSRQNAQLLAAGCGLEVLLADIHAFLDSLRTPIELVESRVEFYRRTITAMLEAGGDSTEKLTFVLGSSYQQSPQYIMNVYKLSSHITEHDAKRAGADIVKQSTNGPLSGLLYPILQVLD